jgi:F-type H+-transporting ATPase subunit b
MLIDWFTVGAQIVNFLVLIWLLKHFLYKPVLGAIDAREQHISQREQEAADAKAAAELERSEFAFNNTRFEQQHAALLEQARTEAQTARRQLLESARQEASDLRSQWQEALRKEQQSLRQSITTRTSHEVFAIARKTLAELADAELESRIVAVFIQRLQAMDKAEKRQLQPLQADGLVVIRSAFAFPEKEQVTLTQAVRNMLQTEPNIRIETDGDLLSGIELVSNGRKVAWTITDYLTDMEAGIGKLLDSRANGEQAHAA